MSIFNVAKHSAEVAGAFFRAISTRLYTIIFNVNGVGCLRWLYKCWFLLFKILSNFYSQECSRKCNFHADIFLRIRFTKQNRFVRVSSPFILTLMVCYKF